MWETIFFWVFAAGAVISSLAVVLIPRNPLYSALALIVDFFFFAGLYGLLSAHFLAVTQVLVYGGAIMVLFMFIIMLLNIRDDGKTPLELQVHPVIGVGSAVALLVILISALMPLANMEEVVAKRDAFQAAVVSAEEAGHEYDDSEKLLATMSPVPGLFSDLNEAALESTFSGDLVGYASGAARPAAGRVVETNAANLIAKDGTFIPKYREYDDTTPVVVPPELLPKEDDEIAPRKATHFGTIEPLAVLLVNRFVVPFELTAILLLAAVIGAMIIAKKRL